MEPGGPYKIYVDDNFHYQDESERELVGAYPDCNSAVAACKQIVETWLHGRYRAGMSAPELYEEYTSFGDDPWISSPDKGCKFSAWTYAQARCAEICG
jgi:hypothetical protein